jgi:Tol biopolymer transport system component
MIHRFVRSTPHSLRSLLPVFLSFTVSSTHALDLVTTREDGSQFEGIIRGSGMSEDGNLVVFDTDVDLLPEDTNGFRDVYLKDRTTRELFLISKNAAGITTNGHSDNPRISAAGNLIVFASQASNLITGDMNGNTDVFLYNRDEDTTTRVSVDAGGNEITGNSSGADISADGSRVMFVSTAPLIGTDTNGRGDIFLRTIANPATLRLVTKTPAGDAGAGYFYVPSLSRNGRYVSYWYQGAMDLAATDTDEAADIYRYDGITETNIHVSRNAAGTAPGNGSATHASMSGDGSRISYRCTSTDVIAEDTDSVTDIYVYDFTLDSTFLVSVNSEGDKSDMDSYSGPYALSLIGNKIAFTSDSTNLGGQPAAQGHAYLRDFVTGETICLTDTADGSGPDSLISQAEISSDGETVLITASATNLVNYDEFGDDTDIFAYPGIDLTVDPSIAAIAAANAAMKTKLRRKLSKLRKKLRTARRGDKVARIKSLKRQISKKKRAIRKL